MFDVFQIMIFNSIKWRLQIWYGLILVVVLAGFGFTAYQLERGRLFGRIDDGFNRRFRVLANALHHPPPRGSEGNGQPFDRPPPGQFPDDGPPRQNPRPPLEFHLSPEDSHFFNADDPNDFYFIIQSRNGNEIARSANVPNEKDVTYVGKNFNEFWQDLPSGERLRVGCSIALELKELDRTAMKLAGIGGIILLFGLAGGWWFVSRALRPVENISAAAVKISAGDLSQRINVAEAESELGQLAAVLNSTFARLESSFAQQKQFASDAAHELRTPVSVLLTQTQLSLSRERSPAEYRQTVESCQRAAQRMRRLIESLLALARLDAGQEPMKRLNFDLADLARDCAGWVRPLAEARGLTLVLEPAPAPCVGDSERLGQVLTNLLTNAIEYNRPHGEVRITTSAANDTAILTVRDTGAGIAPADLPRVFERFYRSDQSRTSGGNGLGLSICKAIVDAHGGSLEAASELNVGTTFTVRLPAR